MGGDDSVRAACDEARDGTEAVTGDSDAGDDEGSNGGHVGGGSAYAPLPVGSGAAVEDDEATGGDADEAGGSEGASGAVGETMGGDDEDGGDAGDDGGEGGDGGDGGESGAAGPPPRKKRRRAKGCKSRPTQDQRAAARHAAGHSR